MTCPLVRFESVVPAVSLSTFLLVPSLLAGETVRETEILDVINKCSSAVVKTAV